MKNYTVDQTKHTLDQISTTKQEQSEGFKKKQKNYMYLVYTVMDEALH